MAGIKAMKQNMFDEFQIKGYWRLPESELEVSGILFYNQNKIHLELLGKLKRTDGILSFNHDNNEIILGRSDMGEEFTLLDASTLKSSVSFQGFSTESYTIGSFLVGGCFNNREEINFHSGTFNPTYLTKWLNRPVFVNEITFDEQNIITNNQVNYNKPSTFKHYVTSINSTIEETYSYIFGGDYPEKVLWKQKSGFKFIPDEWHDFDWFFDNMFVLKDLFSLFIGQAIYFENITFFGEEKNTRDSSQVYRKNYKYFFGQYKSKLKSNFTSFDIMIDFSDVEDNFSSILNFWFEKHNVLQTVYELYFSNYYKDIYLDTTFLNTVQTLEIYHRKSFRGKRFEKDHYNTLSKQVKDFAKEKLPDEFASLVINMFAHGNEFSLANRIEELMENLDEDTKIRFIGDSDEVKRFIRQLVQTRNYLTHYDSNNKKNLLKTDDEKFFAIKRLMAITTLILFKEIGLKESFILEKVSNSKQYSYVLTEAKKVLN
ncbi:HEPN domain-containing protein [Peribacillus sp. TH24]|uniref:ApeA N-terminal domain 1-containing protein n=1 Tax=Peribacillus sp. TH24 TaxID=2798483 RepID=UPI001913948F|nr:HEPN domain-containing protein [Peribacillus sp. TH24]MBK5444163.1 hypothetical protein [Peribacillus sp. TH24]